MKTLIINYDLNKRIESINFGTEFFDTGVSPKNGYYELGSYCIFLSKHNWTYGLKFYIVKDINYTYNVIINIFNIYQLLYRNNWGTKPFSIFKYMYKDNINWAIKIEKAENTSSGKDTFNKEEFRKFCSDIKGLKKDEPQFEELYGKDWTSHHPELQFYVGTRNLKKTNKGKTVLIDIDPRWSWDN